MTKPTPTDLLSHGYEVESSITASDILPGAEPIIMRVEFATLEEAKESAARQLTSDDVVSVYITEFTRKFGETERTYVKSTRFRFTGCG